MESITTKDVVEGRVEVWLWKKGMKTITHCITTGNTLEWALLVINAKQRKNDKFTKENVIQHKIHSGKVTVEI